MARRFAFLLLFFILLAGCKSSYILENAEVQDIAIDTTVLPDLSVDALIRPYRDELRMEMEEELGLANMVLTLKQPESLLGNWVCDQLYMAFEKDSIDFVVQNHGGIRVPLLDSGTVTKGEIFEMLPFDNFVVIVEMNSTQLKEFLDHMAGKGGWPVSRQLRYQIKDGKAEFAMIKSRPLELNKTYRVLMNDYIAGGGDGCFMLMGLPLENTGKFTRTAIIDHIVEERNKYSEVPLEGGYVIASEIDGRIIDNDQ